MPAVFSRLKIGRQSADLDAGHDEGAHALQIIFDDRLAQEISLAPCSAPILEFSRSSAGSINLP